MPASAGARDRGCGAAQRRECGHGGELAGLDELLRDRLERRPMETVDCGHERGDHEQQQRRSALRQQRVHDERERAERHQRLAAQQQLAPVERVGERAAPERGERERNELHAADQAYGRRGLREREHLHRQRDVGDERAERAHELADEHEAEVAVAAQR